MPHLVTALFNNSGQAQQALQALMEMGIASSRMTAMGISESREISSISGFRSLSAENDNVLGALRHLSLPVEDLDIFEHSLRKGYTLVAAQVGLADRDEAIRVLEMFGPVDLDRSAGNNAAGAFETGTGMPLAAGVPAEGLTNADSLPGMGTMASGGDLGTSDLRTDDARLGSSTVPIAGPGEHREERPGVNELRRDGVMADMNGPLRRETDRRGAVWSYRSV